MGNVSLSKIHIINYICHHMEILVIVKSGFTKLTSEKYDIGISIVVVKSPDTGKISVILTRPFFIRQSQCIFNFSIFVQTAKCGIHHNL